MQSPHLWSIRKLLSSSLVNRNVAQPLLSCWKKTRSLCSFLKGKQRDYRDAKFSDGTRTPGHNHKSENPTFIFIFKKQNYLLQKKQKWDGKNSILDDRIAFFTQCQLAVFSFAATSDSLSSLFFLFNLFPYHWVRYPWGNGFHGSIKNWLVCSVCLREFKVLSVKWDARQRPWQFMLFRTAAEQFVLTKLQCLHVLSDNW